MHIGLIGATGMIGARILEEALSRGHDVRAIVRNPANVAMRPHVTAVAADATDAAAVAAATRGLDLVISAYGPGNGPQDDLSKNAHALLEGLTASGVQRLLIVGGAGSLEVAPGALLVDAPGFPAASKPRAIAQAAALDIFRAYPGSALTWTFVCPAAQIAPGTRTGAYRLGGDQLMRDASGASKISAEDFAVALLDEAERPTAPNRRISVAY